MKNWRDIVGFGLLGLAGLTWGQQFDLFDYSDSANWQPTFQPNQPPATLTSEGMYFVKDTNEVYSTFSMDVRNFDNCPADSIMLAFIAYPYMEVIPFGDDPFSFDVTLKSNPKDLIKIGETTYCLPQFAIAYMVDTGVCSNYDHGNIYGSNIRSGVQFHGYCFNSTAPLGA
jgi:hypothetical protein